MKESKIESTPEAWESGGLGREEEFVRVAENVDSSAIDEALELRMISIRLQKSLIEDFKMIAKLNGIGYQPLIRQVLMRFADAEKKQLLREAISQFEKETHESESREEQHRACG
jgi:hypothetical protein